MPIGSILSKFKEVKISTADNKTYNTKMNFLAKTAIKIIGIPHIGFRIRARKILNLFKKINKNSKILDAGCGYGIYSMILAEKGYSINAIDIEKERISEINSMKKQYKKIESKINAITGTLTKLHYKKESFDVVLSSEVIEHIKNDSKAFSELARVLKKRGILILTIPIDSKYNRKEYKKFGHERPGYHIKDLKKLADKNNLRIKKIFFHDYLFGILTFKIHNSINSKAIMGLFFYLFYIISFLDTLKIGEPSGAIIIFEKIN